MKDEPQEPQVRFEVRTLSTGLQAALRDQLHILALEEAVEDLRYRLIALGEGFRRYRVLAMSDDPADREYVITDLINHAEVVVNEVMDAVGPDAVLAYLPYIADRFDAAERNRRCGES